MGVLRVAKEASTLVSKEKKMSFSDLEEEIMTTLEINPRASVLKKLNQLFHPLFNYYINFQLFSRRIYDQHDEYPEAYQILYEKCLTLIPKLDTNKATYNVIKLYINKSVQGWLFNLLYKKSSRLDVTRDDLAMATVIDPYDYYGDIECNADFRRMEEHIRREGGLYAELHNVLFDHDYLPPSRLRRYFRDRVYLHYHKTGNLLSAGELAHQRFGGLFGKEDC